MIHIHQPEVGRLSSGHLDLEECQFVGRIKGSRTFMLKVGAELQMCFFPSHSSTIWSAGLGGRNPACGVGQLVCSKPVWPVVLLYFML